MNQRAPVPTDIDKVILRVRRALAPLMVSKDHWHLSLNSDRPTATGKRRIQIKVEMYETVEIGGEGA